MVNTQNAHEVLGLTIKPIKQELFHLISLSKGNKPLHHRKTKLEIRQEARKKLENILKLSLFKHFLVNIFLR